MPAQTGISVLLSVEDIAVPGTYIDLLGQRDMTLNRSSATIDATHKKSGRFREKLGHFAEWSVSGETLYIPDDPQYAALDTAYENGTKINVRMEDAAGNTYTGAVWVTDFTVGAPMDEMSVVSVALDGAVGYVKAP